MQDDQGGQTGGDIVDHDTQAAMEVPIQPVDGKGFDNIKKTEEQQANQHRHRVEGGGGERNQHADNFIDDNQGGIPVIDDFFRSACTEDTNDEQEPDHTKVSRQGYLADHQPDKDAHQRSPGAGGLGQVPAASPGGDKHQQTIHGGGSGGV